MRISRSAVLAWTSTRIVDPIVRSRLVPPRARRWQLRRQGLDIGAATIAWGVRFRGTDVTIGDDAVIAPRVHLDATAPIVIGPGATVGAAARLLTATEVIADDGSPVGALLAAPILIPAGTVIRAGAVVRGSMNVRNGVS